MRWWVLGVKHGTEAAMCRRLDEARAFPDELPGYVLARASEPPQLKGADVLGPCSGRAREVERFIIRLTRPDPAPPRGATVQVLDQTDELLYGERARVVEVRDGMVAVRWQGLRVGFPLHLVQEVKRCRGKVKTGR